MWCELTTRCAECKQTATVKAVYLNEEGRIDVVSVCPWCDTTLEHIEDVFDVASRIAVKYAVGTPHWKSA